MPREKAGYADNLIRIRERFPKTEVLRPCDVAEFLGMDRHTVRRMIQFNEKTKRVTIQDFARQISV